jgi:Zn-dependent peptidase ImmA (M78 family)
MDELGVVSRQLVTSYFEPPGVIHLNAALKEYPTRIKYDLAVYIGHCVLHSSEGLVSTQTIGNHTWGSNESVANGSPIDPKEILQAWRSFEASFFAGALLCPKVPYRQLLDRHGYEIDVHKVAGVSPSVAMRRMTVVSPYPHWHYFDAHAPGKLKAVYRGNGIPLPWGNMREVNDPCQHWSVFRMLSEPQDSSCAQISILDVNEQPRLYCCESVSVVDPAGNKRVLCAGLDLNPAIEAQGRSAQEIAGELKSLCVKGGGEMAIPRTIKKELSSVARILNINWIERGIERDARLICSRGNVCPRKPSCYEK